MDPFLTEEQIMLRDSVREFTARYCPPDEVRKWDEERTFPRHVYDAMAEHGYFGIGVDEEHGGSGGDIVDQAVMVEELVRGGTTGLGFGLHNDVVAPYLIDALCLGDDKTAGRSQVRADQAGPGCGEPDQPLYPRLRPHPSYQPRRIAGDRGRHHINGRRAVGRTR